MDSDSRSIDELRALVHHTIGLQMLTFGEVALQLNGGVLAGEPTTVADVTATMERHTTFLPLRDDQFISVTNQLDGMAFATHIGESDADVDVLRLSPDLDPLVWKAIAGVTLPSGVELEFDDDTEPLLYGPPGWLSSFAGLTVAVRCVDHVIHIDVVEHAEPTQQQADAYRTTFATTAETEDLTHEWIGQPSEAVTWTYDERLRWAVLVAHRELFCHAPMPGHDDLCRAAQLHSSDGVVSNSEHGLANTHRLIDRDRIARVYSFDPSLTERAESVIFMGYGVLIDTGPDDGAVAAAVSALNDPRIASAVWTDFRDNVEPTDLMTLCDKVIGAAGDASAVGVQWLRAQALAADGRPLDAFNQLSTAAAAQPTHPLLRVALAELAADGGRAKEAVALLESLVTADGDPAPDFGANTLMDEVYGYSLAVVKAPVGRNDRCPCGSGRKYKVCHSGQERVALLDRAPWLYDKAVRFVHHSSGHVVLTRIIDLIYEASEQGPEFRAALRDSKLAVDLVLSEDGYFERFVAHRGELLPDDELVVAQRWETVERSLFEIKDIARHALLLRDLRTESEVLVTNTTPSQHSTVGALMLGRPLPVDDTWRAYGGFIEIPKVLSSTMLNVLDTHDSLELAALIGAILSR
jgi:SEC-C motif